MEKTGKKTSGGNMICLAPLVFLFFFQFAAAADIPPVNVPDTMAERVKACITCHGPEDKKGRDVYYPRIAGKPEGYLFNQLRNFRDGRRHYQPMAWLLKGLPDQYLRDMAAYFASLKQIFPPPEPMSSASADIELARKLIFQGDPAREIPACVECHGKDLMGTAPFIPGLLGLPRIYIIAQFGSWQNGGMMRGQTSDCMSEIAKQLTTAEANVIATWLAAQPVSEALLKQEHSAALSEKMARRCSSIVMPSPALQ
ncbi:MULTISPECIES: c-type cytochrome [Nitrosomonas]|uniref:Cytochrome c553 n=1 Tax=Nitrosomonas communis TaxID=44574 RepID=A0A5D3YEQ6_9PROT|nr:MULTISPECIES: cytochrome c [Nitrosomonas]TYP91119.1 cytochrome c553 [Nitrosomonas communis]